MLYYAVRTTHTKSITFNVNLSGDKRKKASNYPVKINGSFPRPNPALMKPGASYLSEAEKTALELEPSFNELVSKSKIVLHKIPFKDLPENLQKEYDLGAYKKLKAETKQDK